MCDRRPTSNPGVARSQRCPRLLADLNNRVPFERYVALMRNAKAMTGDSALALHYGAAANLGQFSIVGLIASAPALARAIV